MQRPATSDALEAPGDGVRMTVPRDSPHVRRAAGWLFVGALSAIFAGLLRPSAGNGRIGFWIAIAVIWVCLLAIVIEFVVASCRAWRNRSR